MQADPNPPLPEAQARRVRLMLWASLLVSQLIYAGILLSGLVPVAEEPMALPLPAILGVAAALTGAAGHFFWRRASGDGATIHASAPEPAAAHTSYVIAWVLDESIAIYGLVLGFLAFPMTTWSLFSVAAFVLMLLHRPR
ncbi:MAG: hypothetical protein HKP30_15660 [Myxococcales bacterium]|nr:hypothetical protein [Myxococcales bacterium]